MSDFNDGNLSNVLILGGAGFVGSVLCEKLVEHRGGAGRRIVVATRRVARARHIQMLPTVEVVEADLYDDAQLSKLVAGCDSVVNLVAILHGSQADFERVHVGLVRRLITACSDAGVRRVVHVSALGADLAAPSRYLRSKAAGEMALQQSKLDFTVLRPSVIFGAGDRFLNLFARLQAVLPVVPLVAAYARFQPVWVDDVAEAIVRALDTRATVGQTLECAGPAVYTLAEVVRLAGRYAGHARLVLPVPVVVGRLLAAVIERLPGEALISRDNIDSMQVPNVASGTLPGLEQMGIVPTSLEAVARDILGR